MALEEIEKLRMRVEKDPTSRLFLPLAEEYRKSGMLDEAIGVLLGGLAQHPTYSSARVALGRIYLEKDMVSEAKTEFEKVVSVVSGNLFAHRKLADIYRDLGDAEKAASEYKTVLALNPLDEEAFASLEAIEGKKAEEEPVASFSPAEKETVRVEGLGKPAEGEAREDTHQEPEAYGAEEVVEGEPAEVLEDQFFGEEFEEFSRALSQDSEGPAALSAEVFELPDELHVEDDFAEAYPPERGKEVSSAMDISAADSLIKGGNYAKAVDAYLGLLAKNPDNKELLQRMAELKAYLKLTGESEEVLIARLETFRDGIKRRFDADSLST